MKQIDTLDSLTHLNFPDSTAKDSREKIGSFLLATFGIFGLIVMSNPVFQYANSSSIESKKVTKFWLTPSSLNAEKTALNTALIQSRSTDNQLIISANAVAAETLNY